MARGGAIYLGNDAEIEFERRSLKTYGRIFRENINEEANRWSFDYADSVLITGDRIRITRTDRDEEGGRKPLILQSNFLTAPALVRNGADSSNSWEFFVYVDLLGRIYGYETLAESLTLKGADALPLTQGFTDEWERTDANADYFQRVEIQIIEQGFRPFAKCNEYTLTTNRDTIDVTTLGEYFYKQYENGLIQGQGTVTAIFDEQALVQEGCQDPYVDTPAGDELSAYFAKLVLRIQIGAGFRGRFYLRTRDDDRTPDEDRWAVYWQAECVCTNVAIQALPGAMLQTRIEFVTTGLFQLEIADRGFSSILQTEDELFLEREGDAGLLLTD